MQQSILFLHIVTFINLKIKKKYHALGQSAPDITRTRIYGKKGLLLGATYTVLNTRHLM
jgi:hypothetical protein